jgi:hypothetical protein
LTGLTHVGLEVLPLPSSVADAGMTETDLFSFVKDRLEGATTLGVLTRTGALHVDGNPTLRLDVAATTAGADTFLHTVVFGLVQVVALERHTDGESRIGALTWGVQRTALGPPATARTSTELLVDAFIADFTSA